jgi:hypothetical protein
MALALSACATPPHTERYSGTWDWHFETSAFTTDDARGPWWLHAEGAQWEQINAPLSEAASPWGRVHLIVEGELSKPGRYGHLGDYERQFRVTRVIGARRVEPRP